MASCMRFLKRKDLWWVVDAIPVIPVPELWKRLFNRIQIITAQDLHEESAIDTSLLERACEIY